jgi:DNA-directed RNA polymerase specialized sigma24 family protein
MLDAPVGTIKGRMRLGMDKLRHSLEGAGVVIAG